MVGRIASWTHGVHADAFRTKITGLQVFTVITGVETALTDSFQYRSNQFKLLFNGSRWRLLSEHGPENELNLPDDRSRRNLNLNQTSRINGLEGKNTE
jgi:hypothetical protein